MPTLPVDRLGPDTGGPALRLSELIASLSYALDLTEGQPLGHANRTCMIGMGIGKEIGVAGPELSDLYYALLLKDAGCSSNASKLFHILGGDEIKAKREVKLTDWTKVGWESLQYALRNVRAGAPLLERLWGLMLVSATQKKQSRELVQIRCERGASIARQIGLSERSAEAIHYLDEHWNGCGYPEGRRGEDIPRLSRVLNLAQTLEVFSSQQSVEAALSVMNRRNRTWFDPDLVRAALSCHRRSALFPAIQGGAEERAAVLALEPQACELPPTQQVLDQVCQAFADVIDAKTPFTYRHSTGVANVATGIASVLGLPPAEVQLVERAALLHDIGKLGVPNSILEKPGKLDDHEWEAIKAHPAYSFQILRRVRQFRRLAQFAGAHHEKLDGSGYFRGLSAEDLAVPVRILTVADIFDALAAKRPYRDALPVEQALSVIRKDAPGKLDPACVEALAHVVASAGDSLVQLQRAVGRSDNDSRQGQPASLLSGVQPADAVTLPDQITTLP